MMGLSEETKQELLDKLRNVNHHLQYKKMRNQFNLQRNTQGAPDKDDFHRRHSEYFATYLDLSEGAKEELEMILQHIWRVLYDPNAYQDPNFDAELASRLKILFEDGPPPCCNQEMYHFALP